jgi:hypothetical protein
MVANLRIKEVGNQILEEENEGEREENRGAKGGTVTWAISQNQEKGK